MTEPIKVDIIDEVKPEEPPPPPPPVKAVELPPVSVPPVLVDIQIPVDPPPIAITTAPPPPGPPAPVVYGPPAPPGPPSPPAPVGTPYSVTYKPDVADFYPPRSLQMEETGRPVVKVCWDVKGKVVESTLAEPSGKKALDDAAIRYGKNIKFKPGTSDGQAVGGCARRGGSFQARLTVSGFAGSACRGRQSVCVSVLSTVPYG